MTTSLLRIRVVAGEHQADEHELFHHDCHDQSEVDMFLARLGRLEHFANGEHADVELVNVSEWSDDQFRHIGVGSV